MRAWGCVVLGCLFAAPLWAAGWGELPPDAVIVDDASAKPDPARMAVEAGAVLAKVRSGQAEAAITLLHAIDAPLRFELTAARVIQSVANEPAAAADDFLARLEREPVRVFIRQEESRADWFVPLVDVAGKARSARAVLARRAQRDAWLELLATDAKSAFAASKSDTPALADAIARAPESVIASLVQASAKSPQAVLPSAAQTELAKRTRDVGAWDRALAQAEPVDVLPLFALAKTNLAPDDARRWLDRAATMPDYASAAAMVRAEADDAGLAARLDASSTRAEAAATLARAPDALARIDRLLADPAASSTRLASLALALRLIDSDAARARLQSLAVDPRLPAPVRTELQR